MSKKTGNGDVLRCSFCNKSQRDVKKLIAGPTVYICDECVDICLDIIAIVTLGYLGLGVQPPTPDWGRMIADGQTFLTTHWELSTIPGIAVVITALGLSLLADGLADLLRPE